MLKSVICIQYKLSNELMVSRQITDEKFVAFYLKLKYVLS